MKQNCTPNSLECLQTVRERKTTNEREKMTKMVRELKKMMKRNGIEISSIEKGKRSAHLKIYLPNGRYVVTGCTPSDHRALKNTISQARREMTEVSFAA